MKTKNLMTNSKLKNTHIDIDIDIGQNKTEQDWGKNGSTSCKKRNVKDADHNSFKK